MKYRHVTSPEVCSTAVTVELEEDRIRQVEFEGGCPGSLQAVGRLVAGLTVQEAAERLADIRCGTKSTSCPAQLAAALREIEAGKLLPES